MFKGQLNRRLKSSITSNTLSLSSQNERLPKNTRSYESQISLFSLICREYDEKMGFVIFIFKHHQIDLSDCLQIKKNHCYLSIFNIQCYCICTLILFSGYQIKLYRYQNHSMWRIFCSNDLYYTPKFENRTIKNITSLFLTKSTIFSRLWIKQSQLLCLPGVET